MPLNLFVTGTDTGVGKTVLSVLLTRTLLARGRDVMAAKPFCSGGRSDARSLCAVLATMGRGRVAAVSLDDVNPWHFREPLTPLVAARRTGRTVAAKDALAFLRTAGRRGEILLIEGAGGLLSPLGEGFDARDLIAGLEAVPLVVAANRLGVLNHVLLTWEALPRAARRHAQLVLMEPARPGRVSRTNGELLAERLGVQRVHRLPWLPARVLKDLAFGAIPGSARMVLERLAGAVAQA